MQWECICRMPFCNHQLFLSHSQQRRLRLTPEQASDFYAEHYGKMFFPSLIAYMQRYDGLIV